jgi:hypothetical protein
MSCTSAHGSGNRSRQLALSWLSLAPPIPGLLHLETTLSLLDQIRAVAAVLGSPCRRWSKAVWQSSGPMTKALDDSGRLIVIPHDSRLAAVGLDSRALPRQLLEAADAILELAGSAMGQAH